MCCMAELDARAMIYTPYVRTHQVYQRPLLGGEGCIRQLCVLRMQRVPHGVKSAKTLLNHPSPVVDETPRKKAGEHETGYEKMSGHD